MTGTQLCSAYGEFCVQAEAVTTPTFNVNCAYSGTYVQAEQCNTVLQPSSASICYSSDAWATCCTAATTTTTVATTTTTLP